MIFDVAKIRKIFHRLYQSVIFLRLFKKKYRLIHKPHASLRRVYHL